MASTPITEYIARYNSTLNRKEWRRRGATTVVVGDGFGGAGPAPVQGQKFAGHVPNRVLIGMATPSGNPPPGWTEAGTIVGQPIYEARRFAGGWVTTSAFNGMVGEADAATALPQISFKVPGGSTGAGWAAVANGNEDAGLLSLFNLVVGYNKPLICSFEHEPTGSVTNAELCEWARMHIRCAYYFAGYRACTVGAFTTGGSPTVTKGTYNAAHDISLNNAGKMSWGPIPNGFVWRAETSTLINQRVSMVPAALVTALNECKGILCPDFYDVDYVDHEAAFTDETKRTPGSGVRTSSKISKFITWQRANGLNASGCGEYGCIDSTDMLATWAVMRANRDVWCLANHFNSAQNSDHDWRLVPNGYPDTGYVSSKTNTAGEGFRIYGGNAQSQGRLDAFKTTLTESISAAYTEPL